MEKEELQATINNALASQQEEYDRKQLVKQVETAKKHNKELAITGILFPMIAALLAYFAGVSQNLSTEKSILSTEKAIQLASKELGKKFDDKVELFEQRIRSDLKDNQHFHQSFQQSQVDQSIKNANTIARALLLSEKAQELISRIEKSYEQIQYDEESIIGLKQAAKNLVENKAGIKPKQIAKLLESSVTDQIKDMLIWQELPEQVPYFNVECEYRLVPRMSLEADEALSVVIPEQQAIYPTFVNSLSLTSSYYTTKESELAVVSARYTKKMLVYKLGATKQPTEIKNVTIFERCLTAEN